LSQRDFSSMPLAQKMFRQGRHPLSMNRPSCAVSPQVLLVYFSLWARYSSIRTVAWSWISLWDWKRTMLGGSVNRISLWSDEQQCYVIAHLLGQDPDVGGSRRRLPCYQGGISNPTDEWLEISVSISQPVHVGAYSQTTRQSKHYKPVMGRKGNDAPPQLDHWWYSSAL